MNSSASLVLARLCLLAILVCPAPKCWAADPKPVNTLTPEEKAAG